MMLAAAVVIAIAVSAPASAAPKPKPPKAPACPTAAELEQPFLQFADAALYFLAPNGSFERSGWSGGLSVNGNEPFFVRAGGARDKRSMSIAAPNVATSPATCIGLGDPTIRFFAERVGGSPLATLGVTVVFEDVLGGEQRLPLLSVVAPTPNTWAPTVPTPILANATLLPKALGTDPVDGLPTGSVTFVLTPSAGSTWQVDDFYVDPYKRN